MEERIYPFTNVSFGGVWQIKVDPNYTLGKQGMLCIGTDGLFETGTAQSSGVDRQYADGRVLPSKNILQGKSFNVTIILHGSPSSVYSDLNDFQDYVMKNVFTVSTNRGSIERCIGQQVRIEDELYTENTMYLTISVEVSSENSFFNFT